MDQLDNQPLAIKDPNGGALAAPQSMAETQPNVADVGRLLPEPVFHDPQHHVKIYQGGCLEILAAIPGDCVDLIFADPPYFLSNDGITCHAGKMVSVNKGKWDKSQGPDLDHEFNRAWLAACQRTLVVAANMSAVAGRGRLRLQGSCRSSGNV